MLVLGRFKDESIMIGDQLEIITTGFEAGTVRLEIRGLKQSDTLTIGEEVKITVVRVRSKNVRIGITAPKSIPVNKKETQQKGGNTISGPNPRETRKLQGRVYSGSRDRRRTCRHL